MTFPPITVLMTGAGAPGAPSIIKCLRNNGERNIRIVGADMNEAAACRSLVDVFYQIPAAGSDSFIQEVFDICIKEKVQLLITFVTKELERFASSKKLFEDAGIKLSVMDLEPLHIANNKGLLLNAMKCAGLPTAKFLLANTAEEVDAAIHALGYPEKAVVIKPTFGNGSRGTRILDAGLSKYDLFFNQKPNSMYMSYTELMQTLRECNTIPEMMVMEYLPGVEYSVDVLADHGTVLEIVCRKGSLVINSIMVGSVIEQNPKVLDICEKVTQLLKLDGNVGFDLREDEFGVPFVMEINPRLAAGVVACAVAGINFPYLRVKQLLGEELPKVHLKEGTVMQRRYQEIFFDVQGNEILW